MKLRVLRLEQPGATDEQYQAGWLANYRFYRWRQSLPNGVSRPYWRNDGPLAMIIPPTWTDAETVALANNHPGFDLVEMDFSANFVAVLPQL